MRVPSALLALAFCATPSVADPVEQVGGARHIACYSGGVKILDDDSDPREPTRNSRVMTSFLSASTHRFVSVTADCIVSWADPIRRP